MKKAKIIIATSISMVLISSCIPVTSEAFLDEPVYGSVDEIVASYGEGALKLGEWNDGTTFFISEDGSIHAFVRSKAYTELIPAEGCELDNSVINAKLGEYGDAESVNDVVKVNIKYGKDNEAYKALEDIEEIGEIRNSYDVMIYNEGMGYIFAPYMFVSGEIEDADFIAENPELGLTVSQPEAWAVEEGYTHAFELERALSDFYGTGSYTEAYTALKRLSDSGCNYILDFHVSMAYNTKTSDSKIIETIFKRTELPTSQTVSEVKGDANTDGKITISDAVAVLQYIANAEKYPLSEQAKLNADIDGEEGITGGDAISIQKIDAGVF